MSKPITPPASDEHLPHGLAIRRGVYVVKIAIKGHRRAFSTAIRAGGFKLTKRASQGKAGGKVSRIELITPDEALLLASKVAKIWQKAASGHLSPEEATQELFSISPEGTPRPWLRYNRLSNIITKATYTHSVASYLTSYLKERADDSSFKRIEHACKRFIKHLGKQGDRLLLANITPAHCEPFIIDESLRIKQSSLKVMKGHLSKAFNKAVERGLLASNPFKHLSPEKLFSASPTRAALSNKRGLFTLEQLQYMIAHFEPHLAYIVLVCSITGRGVKDVCLMQWQDIDLDAGLWYCSSHRKPHRSHVVALPRLLLDEMLKADERINQARNGMTSEPLAWQFTSSPASISRAFTGALKVNGFTDLRLLSDDAIKDAENRQRRGLTHGFSSIKPTAQAILATDGQCTPAQVQAQFSIDESPIAANYQARHLVASRLLALLVPDVASGTLARLFPSS